MLTTEQKQFFIDNGYVVLRNIVPQELVEAALRRVDTAFEEGEYTLRERNSNDVIPIFSKEVEHSPAVYECMTKTPIPEACDDLLGEGNSRCGRHAQVAFRWKDERLIKKGMKINENMPKYRWHIDGGSGKYMKTASGFTLLVGVVLSEGQDVDENRGQFTVWPGS